MYIKGFEYELRFDWFLTIVRQLFNVGLIIDDKQYIISKEVHNHGSSRFRNIAEAVEKRHIDNAIKNPD